MSLKRYGIYLDWGPVSDLRAEGLGRQLASFLKGAAERPDVRFVIACPSWGREQVRELCEAEHVPQGHFDLLSPEQMPLSLRIYRTFEDLRHRKRPPRRLRFRALWAGLDRVRIRVERRLVSTRSPAELTALIIVFMPVLVVFALWELVCAVRRPVRHLMRRAARHLRAVRARRLRGLPCLPLPQIQIWRRFYRHLEQTETDLLIAMIDRRADIVAWYCPTAFWPQFNRIRAQRLLCVPDVVVSAFPVGFELGGGQPLFEDFQQLQTAIRGAEQVVTYSEHVKWEIVVRDYELDPDRVHVVPHAAQELLGPIKVSGTADSDVATDAFCRQLLLRALDTAPNPDYAADFRNDRVEFIFFASQFRPNKNVVTLLRAFEYLLRARYTGVKLILTGVWENEQVRGFVEAKRLSHDVLFVHNVPLQQLAALYRLARVAVNPSLSEGGFPFTFSEALSVGTPVVMSRIAVTEEAVTDPDLQAAMLFDPYDWRDMALRIEWALKHRTDLLEMQKPLFDRIARRSWRHVVDDHIDILDRIALRAKQAVVPR